MRICTVMPVLSNNTLPNLAALLQEHVEEGRVLWDQSHWQQDQRGVQEHHHGGSHAAVLRGGGRRGRHGESDLPGKRTASLLKPRVFQFPCSNEASVLFENVPRPSASASACVWDQLFKGLAASHLYCVNPANVKIQWRAVRDCWGFF